ncbi:hypothetical protein DM860_016700 [Cuscuta australis]|uniref:DAGKc domain-containing protein n=1 Tax=Cuscuta australis TaxID=267555 RepID=A0A328DKQ7_9ASTE|nr:hypothetical protein DM860_016700 [Cuscuta australis]
MVLHHRIALVVMMAKPPMIKAEQPLPSGLTFPGASESHRRRRRDLVFVVNPRGANGKTGEQWKSLLPHLRSALSNNYNICESLTSGPHHAIDITREAIHEGADAVIAVGGDGTLHEVVNGFFCGGKPVSSHDPESTYSTALGLIPLGTGSDFARTLGWKNDPHDAIERILVGTKSRVDIGSISGESGEPHYFINVADIHLSAKAGYHASKYKKFGNLCYVIGALQAFFGHHNQDLRIKVFLNIIFSCVCLYDYYLSSAFPLQILQSSIYSVQRRKPFTRVIPFFTYREGQNFTQVDDGEWEVYPQVTALCIGNAKYFGGGMKITPNANPTSGNFEVWDSCCFEAKVIVNRSLPT